MLYLHQILADGQIYDYIADYMEGIITRGKFWSMAKFKYSTRQLNSSHWDVGKVYKRLILGIAKEKKETTDETKIFNGIGAVCLSGFGTVCRMRTESGGAQDILFEL